ncbi:MAG: glutamine synthetase family protein [Patescibacteria group bacterium]|jgi:glutamine synthetase
MIISNGDERKRQAKERIEEIKKDQNIRFIKCLGADMQGHIREVTAYYPRDSDDIDVRNIGVDGSVLFSQIIMTTESDMVFVPDLSTLRKIPWTSDTALVICDLYYPPEKEGEPLKPFEGCTRGILKKLVRKMERNLPKYIKKVQPERKIKNFWAAFAPELEFLLVRKDYDYTKIHLADLKNNHYFRTLAGECDEILKEIVVYLGKLGVKPEKYHTEVAGLQYEINIELSDILSSADNVVIMMYVINAVAKKHGYRFSLIPKFNENVNGSGKHIHENIFAMEEIDGVYQQVNVFYDKRTKDGASYIMRSYTAGNLKYGREYTLLTNPAPISFKRFTKKAEAPEDLFFGWKDRTAFARGHMKGTKKIRTEIRSADGLSNPYSSCAAHLAAGLAGIEEGLVLEMHKGHGYYNYGKENRLPLHFGEALTLMYKSKMLRKYLGNFLIDSLFTLGGIVWHKECTQITDRDIVENFPFDVEEQ